MTRSAGTRRVRTAIVLGAGGTVGIAYHAGVAKALADAGLDPAGADLVVGTSAGAIVGSIVRVGHDLDDVWALAHTDENPFVEDQPFFRPDVIFSQGWRTPVGLARRVVGSAYVLQRSVVRWPVMNPPQSLQRFYRAGLGSVTERARRVRQLGRRGVARRAPCAVHLRHRHRAPGGAGRAVIVATRAARRHARHVGGAVALPTGPTGPTAADRRSGQLVDQRRRRRRRRRGADRRRGTAVLRARRRPAAPPARRQGVVPPAPRVRAAGREGLGSQGLVIRPDVEESHLHGLNLLRGDGHSEVAELSHRRTAQALRGAEGRSFRRAWNAAAAA